MSERPGEREGHEGPLGEGHSLYLDREGSLRGAPSSSSLMGTLTVCVLHRE